MSDHEPQEFQAIDLNYLIDELEQLVAEANRVPFSSKVMVEESALLGIADQLRAAIPAEFRQARRILREQARIIRSAQEEAASIVATAKERSEYLVSQHGVTSEARQRAEQILREANLYRQRAKGEIDRFGLQRLQMVEDALREGMDLITEATENALLTIQEAREEVLPPEE